MSLANGKELNEMKLQSFQFVGKTRSAPESKGEEAPMIEVVFTKESDNSSAALHKAATSAEMVETAKFDFTRQGEDGAVEIVHTLEFVKGYVTSFATSGAGDRPIEVVSVQFEGSA
jgi:type VI protein secretion system component Hcp